MGVYTIPLLTIMTYTLNYLMLYNKNRIFYHLIFIATSATVLYMASESHAEYTLIFFILLALGFISFIYDTFIQPYTKSIAEG